MFNALKQIAAHWGRAGVGSHAAATAYYAIFSIAPLILIAISVAGLALGREAAQSAILDQFGTTFGSDFRGFAEGLIATREQNDTNILGTIIGVVLILLGASGIFGALREGLDKVFENLPKDKKPGFLSGIVDQLISVGTVLSLGFLLLASLLVSTILTSMGGYLKALFPGAQVIALVIDFVVTYILISGFLALLIAFLPSKKVAKRTAMIAGFIAGALFVVGKYALTLYFSLADPAGAFGAASAMVIVVLWAYYLAIGLLVSAIVARLFAPDDLVPTRSNVMRGSPTKGA